MPVQIAVNNKSGGQIGVWSETLGGLKLLSDFSAVRSLLALLVRQYKY
jgi:hypothetical protein